MTVNGYGVVDLIKLHDTVSEIVDSTQFSDLSNLSEEQVIEEIADLIGREHLQPKTDDPEDVLDSILFWVNENTEV
jgi:predicted hydrolase (HD superfamily)